MSEHEKVIELGAHANMTPQEALTLAAREEWTNVIIAGYHKDDRGKMILRSSAMPRQDALWILEHAKLVAMGVL